MDWGNFGLRRQAKRIAAFERGHGRLREKPSGRDASRQLPQPVIRTDNIHNAPKRWGASLATALQNKRGRRWRWWWADTGTSPARTPVRYNSFVIGRPLAIQARRLYSLTAGTAVLHRRPAGTPEELGWVVSVVMAKSLVAKSLMDEEDFGRMMDGRII